MSQKHHKAPEPSAESSAQSTDKGAPGEPKLKLRAKTMITLEGGAIVKAGEIFELPERQALDLVGMQNAEQIT